MNFESMDLDKRIIEGLKLEGIHKPLKVQSMAYETIVKGVSAAVQSETGSGKTLAYLLPLMNSMLSGEKGNRVLVLVPTHELALQVHRQIKSLAAGAQVSVSSAPIVGNVNIRRQLESLKEKPQIIVGTTGRILELIQKKKIAAHLIQTIVVDEADKMLDKKQVDETRQVIRRCMRDVQKLFFSASLSKDTVQVVKEIAPEARFLRTEQKITIPKSIRHVYLVCQRRDKIRVLRSLIGAVKPKRAMVFINRTYDIEEAARRLQYHHYAAECIHGSEKKEERKRVIEQFRNGKINILVGTDLAARGLHFDHMEMVVHYSIPENPKEYLHRAGRCGRNGEKGMSISLVTEGEAHRIREFGRIFGICMEKGVLRNGKLEIAEGKQKKTNAAGRK